MKDRPDWLQHGYGGHCAAGRVLYQPPCLKKVLALSAPDIADGAQHDDGGDWKLNGQRCQPETAPNGTRRCRRASACAQKR